MKSWHIEVLFRWIKQHLNISTLFGTTENAVLGQLFSALMVYVLLKWLFDATNPTIPLHTKPSFVQFKCEADFISYKGHSDDAYYFTYISKHSGGLWDVRC
ncbi:hypothetical protein [Paenibacillus sp. N3.4]|uniref:hypothetical protein n=1 Tax=Paenibacillus sp. N3.4 TaxID=2603222 RepID=UPI0037C8CE09